MKAISDRLDDWARAWARTDIETYLSFYAPEFLVPKHQTKAEWEAQRRSSLSKPAFISVTLQDVDLEILNENTGRARFKQKYRASNFSDLSHKVLLFKKIDSRWLIVDERKAPNPDRPSFPAKYPPRTTTTQTKPGTTLSSQYTERPGS